MGCPECEKNTSGKCVEHSYQIIPLCNSVQPPGHWTWNPTPVCIACGRPTDFIAI